MRVKIDGFWLNYIEQGSGNPLVLLHGHGGDSSSFASVMPTLAQKYRVIAWDQRGFGQSDKLLEERSLENFAEDLYAFLQALHIEKCYLEGSSYGGFVALSFVLRHPEMVEVLILDGTMSRYFPDKAGHFFERRAKMAEEKGMAAVVEDPGIPGQPPQDIDPEMRASIMNNDPRSYAIAGRAAARLNLADRLKEIVCPSLVMVGDMDAITPPPASHTIHHRIPNSELHIIPGCGHTVSGMQPETFARLVVDFLDGVEAGAWGAQVGG